MKPHPDHIPDALAAKVLERAAQLDTTDSRSISLADLRSAALDAGISAAALDRALDELTAPESAAIARPIAAAPPARTRRATALVAGVALAVLLAAGALFVRGGAVALEPAAHIEVFTAPAAVGTSREIIVVPPRSSERNVVPPR